MLRSALVAAFILALFGCSYATTSEDDNTVTRLVENDGACPPADSLEVPGFITDAERTEWHTIDMPPLCFYEELADDHDDACAHTLTTLSGLDRASLLEQFMPDSVTGTVRTDVRAGRCTRDHGAVRIIQGAPECAAGAEGGVLVLEVKRAPYRFCKYETTEEHTRHPSSSCGPSGVFAPG